MAATVAIPDIAASRSYKLDLAARDFAAAMRFARDEAMRLGSPRGFNIQSAARRIRVMRLDLSVSPPTLNYDVYDPVSKKLYDIDLAASSIAAAEVVSLNSTFRGICTQPGEIYFDSTGTARCANPETVLVSQFSISLGLDNDSRSIILDGITGRVTVQ